MKICITSKGEGLQSQFEERFGRSPYFTFHELEAETTESMLNPHADGSGGVGPRAAQLVADKGTMVLITGHLGDNASKAVQQSGIKAFQGRSGMTVAEVLDEYRAGKLATLQ
jgi:predicted Fe-Mo cluster-binding NifX family protein